MSEQPTIADYEEVLGDHRRLVRRLDVALNGEAGAAKQASLCDIIGQVEAGWPWQPIKTAPKNNTKVLIYVPPQTIAGKDYPEIIMVSRWHGYWWDAGHLKPTHWMPLPAAPV